MVDTPLECKKMSYKIHRVDREQWQNDGYDGICEKFVQNTPLLQLLITTAPKTLAEATTDLLWGTGIALRDTCALHVDKWHSKGWLSRMLMKIREDLLNTQTTNLSS